MHRRVLDAIVARDAAGAEAAMLELIHSARDDLAGALRGDRPRKTVALA